MTIATVIQAVAPLCGLGVPGVVIGNADPLTQHLLACAIEECDELLTKNEWSGLVKTASVSTTTGPLATVALASDYDRMTYGAGVWNITRQQRLIGPVEAQDWQAMTVRAVSLWPQRWRLSGDALQIWGAVPGEYLTYEYVSNAYVRAADGTLKAAFTADSDKVLLPEALVKLGIRWRFKKAKGLDYGEDMATYERQLERIGGANLGPRTIQVGGWRPSTDNVLVGTIGGSAGGDFGTVDQPITGTADYGSL